MDGDETYPTINDAVIAAMNQYVPISDNNNQEQGGWIVAVPGTGKNKKKRYKIVVGQAGDDQGINLGPPPPGAVANWHTHPGFDDPGSPVYTDPGDQYGADHSGYPGYAGSGDGWIAISTPRRRHKKDHYPIGHQQDPIIVGVPYDGDPEPTIIPGEVIGRLGRWK